MHKTKLGAKPFLLPQPAVLVGTSVDGVDNFMLAAWCGVANHTPPLVTVAVRATRRTEAGIQASRAFSLNIPSSDMAEQADYCGIVSGKKADKSRVFTTYRGTLPGVPLIQECTLSLECRLVETWELPTHRLHLGEIVEVYADEACLIDGVPQMDKVDPLIYSITDGKYWKIGSPLAKAFHAGRALGG